MIKVKFFTLLRLYLGIDEIDIEADQMTVHALLNLVCEKKGNRLILEKLLHRDGSLLTGTIILINGHDILHMNKLDTLVSKGDSLSLFTPGGGG